MSTVSRALAGSPLVKKKTHERITELASSLNYSINLAAHNLRLGQQNRTIAVIVPYEPTSRQRITDPFIQGMLGNLADAMTERNYDMLLSRVDANRLDLAADFFDTGRAVGLVLIGQWHHHDQLNQLAARRVPMVVWGARLPQQLYACVGGDNREGGRLATAHLLELGRKRLLFLGDAEYPEVAQRHEGYLQALHDAGLAVDPRLYRPVPFLAKNARATVENALREGISFDAIFACSDLLAMAAIAALEQHGVEVPRTVAVSGYDDIELAQYFHPALTTVRQPLDLAAQAIVDSLIKQLANQPTPGVMLPAQLVIRASTQ